MPSLFLAAGRATVTSASRTTSVRMSLCVQRARKKESLQTTLHLIRLSGRCVVCVCWEERLVVGEHEVPVLFN